MRKTLALLAVLVLAVGYWFYRLPYSTAARVSEALRSGNKADLEDTIDFDSLKRSLKDEISATLLKKAHDSNPDSPAGSMFASALIGELGGMAVDALITPSNLSVMIQSGKANLSNSAQSQPKQDVFADADYEYRSLHTFVVRKQSDQGTTECIFRRQGLSWKWVGIQLPR